MKADNSEMQHPSSERAPSEHFFREIEIQFLIHEMKSPIAIVETGLRTLLEKQDRFGPLSERQQKILMRSLRNVVKAREMLNGLLEVGRSEAGVYCCVSFDPVPMLLEVLLEALEGRLAPDAEPLAQVENPADLQRLLEKEGVFFRFTRRVHQIRMCQDETRFRQIVGNLFKNALHHRKSRIDIHVDATDAHLIVEVADDGPGIDPKHHDLIFKRYMQVTDDPLKLSRKGHGLGLAGALIMARSLDGDIRVKSEKGHGATFSLSLPIVFQPGDSAD